MKFLNTKFRDDVPIRDWCWIMLNKLLFKRGGEYRCFSRLSFMWRSGGYGRVIDPGRWILKIIK